MAITINTPQPEKFGWFLNAVTADASGCEELKAAPGAGRSITVNHLTINSNAEITITIGAGKTGGSVATGLIGPVSFAASQSIQWTFPRGTYPPGGIMLPEAVSLTVDSSGPGNICIFAWGRVE